MKDIDQIQIDVCRKFEVHPSDMRKRRTKHLTDIRCIVVKEARNQGYTLKGIGFAICRDHSTIISLLRRYDDYVLCDEEFMQKVEAIAA